MSKLEKSNASGGESSVVQVYSESNERDRLEVHGLEKARTLQILRKRLPPAPAKILDIGGAAGVYSFPLTTLGYEVHLIDPVPLHIQQAKEHGRAIKNDLASYAVGDARKLDHADETVDVVLLFGPLYHLFKKEDRLQALREAARVLRKRGAIFAVGIPRFASLIDAMNKNNLSSKVAVIERDLVSGVHHKISKGTDFMYLHYPTELQEEVVTSGFSDVSLIAVEGPVWHDGVIQQLQQDPSGWNSLLSILEKIEQDESIIGASAHIMAFGQKT